MHKESPRNPLPNIPVIYAAVVVWIYYCIQIKGGVRLTFIGDWVFSRTFTYVKVQSAALFFL